MLNICNILELSAWGEWAGLDKFLSACRHRKKMLGCGFLGRISTQTDTVPRNGAGESHPKAKNLLIFPTRKIPLTKFTFYPIKSVFPSPPNRMQATQDSFIAAVIAVVSFFFNFKVYVLTRCLLNVVFSMTKAWKGQNFPSKISVPSSLNATWKTLLLLMLVSSFPHFFFYF